jgi:hypothetical protein
LDIKIIASIAKNRIGGVMDSMLASCAVDRHVGSIPYRVKPKTIKLIFVDFPLSAQQ